MATAMIFAPPVPKICCENRRGDAVFRGVLDAARQDGRAVGVAVQRQHAQVDDVRQHVEQDHRAGSQGQRQRQIALADSSPRRR